MEYVPQLIKAKTALACATHRRCGAKSPARFLPTDIIQYIMSYYSFVVWYDRGNDAKHFYKYINNNIDVTIEVQYFNPKAVNSYAVAKKVGMFGGILTATVALPATGICSTTLISHLGKFIEPIMASSLMRKSLPLSITAIMFLAFGAIIGTAVTWAGSAALSGLIGGTACASVSHGATSMWNYCTKSDKHAFIVLSRTSNIRGFQVIQIILLEKNNKTIEVIRERIAVHNPYHRITCSMTHSFKTLEQPNDKLEIAFVSNEATICEKTCNCSMTTLQDIERDIINELSNEVDDTVFANIELGITPVCKKLSKRKLNLDVVVSKLKQTLSEFATDDVAIMVALQ